MAQQKKTAKSSTTKKRTPVRQIELKENEKVKKQIKQLKQQQIRENTVMYQIMPIILVFAAFFLLVCFAIPEKMGFLRFVVYFLKGLCGNGIWIVPALLAIEGFYFRKDYVAHKIAQKLITGAFLTVFFSSLLQLFAIRYAGENIFNPIDLYVTGVDGQSAGILGGVLGNLLEKFTGIGAWIICIFAVVFLGFAMFNITPWDMVMFAVNKIKEAVYNANLAKQERLEESIRLQNEELKKKASLANEKSYDEEAEDAKQMRKKRAAFLEDAGGTAGESEDNPEESGEIQPEISEEDISYNNENSVEQSIVDLNAFDEIKRENGNLADNLANSQEQGAGENGEDYSDIFTDDASISIAGEKSNAAAFNDEGVEAEKISAEIDNVPVEPTPTVEEIYHFPPINFLMQDPNPLTFAVTDELKQTSVKLVETLKNFGVKTKIMNICCGPTVTRYELQPEIGVRVRQIANLADDIALHLAANGVRIEAPIPGKDAVGIEVPNKTVSTVYLRNLIESPEFMNQKGKLTVGLGMDVAGSSVYMNIAKMPHLLIAGATGMGKSVCINTFIVSILYKARPDEVKLILIDPKKVELSIYNGLPHLLVPVVSDPKKAAGSLSWAVNEMERRFLLIEEVGVRDIDSYNELTKEDPEKEYMPKIVIIIDELADLMMTARDEVETSICRLAQKARAAGMHLVIGTQRPSVDVITGLIKANVPSRIACTVASQVDSRTIIDVSGAEKLLGRGDMLYAPVGSMKPMRVQGSFVSEKEIENIVEFLKNGKKYEYDADIIESIEREAAKCGEKKKGRGADSDGFDDAEDRDGIMQSDDAILPAIEIAVDSGSVSTSLLQRKLSLGYARAARIVDKLEKLGVVGPFEGSKPRRVLITREEYLQMRMNFEGRED